MSMQFNKFTDKAKEVLQIAQGILGELNQNTLDCEHILMACFEQDGGMMQRIPRHCSAGHLVKHTS